MIYAIVPLDEIESLEKAIEDVDPRACMTEAPKLYFVTYQGTSRELFNELLPKEVNKGLMIFRVHEHYGAADDETWEWINVRKNGY